MVLFHHIEMIVLKGKIMQIDIIIPHYTGTHFLSDALNSIIPAISQDDKTKYNIIIIVDNNSGKKLRDIPGFKHLTDEENRSEIKSLIAGIHFGSFVNVKTVYTKDPQNVASLRNLGMKHASGDYIYFMDSDDYLYPDALSLLAHKAEETGADIIHGGICKSRYKYTTAVASSPDEVSSSLVDTLCSHNFTALHMLIKNKPEFTGTFDTKNELYPDMYFTAELISKTDSIVMAPDSVYVKRLRNDSVRYPSLNQLPRTDRKEMLMSIYTGLRKDYKNNAVIQDALKKITKTNRLKRLDNIKKRIIAFIKRPIFMYRMIEKYIFRKMSMKDNWIVFESFLGKNYSDSCKYIYEYLMENKGSAYRYIWVINDKSTPIPGNVKKVKYLSPAWFYYTSRARYYVNNMRQPKWMSKRPDSIFLETWHGTPLKKLVFDMDDVHSATPSYKMDVYNQSRKWDYLISDNPFSTETFERCFLYPKDRILETGYPRNDILYAEDKEERALRIKNSLGIAPDKKIILYAPTWRDDEYYKPGAYQFALKLDLKRLKSELSDEYVILLRTHYFIADAIDTQGMEGFAYNVSRYNDIAELYLISDICITDYSSVFFDFANLKRPILFYVYDFDKYKDELRGFYIDMNTEVPGPLLYTEDEVINAIHNIDRVKEEFTDRYDLFYDKFCCISDGHSTERIVNSIFNLSKESQA